MDALTQAEQILSGEPEGTLYPFSNAYRADRALTGGRFGARADLNFWVARIDGTDPKMGYKRAFFPKTWPVQYDRRATPAVDLTNVRRGNLIEVCCAESRNRADERTIYRVITVDDQTIRLVVATTDEIKAHIRRKDAEAAQRATPPPPGE